MNIGIEAQRIFRTRKHGMDFVALELIRNLQRIDRENTYHIFVNEGPDRCLEESEHLTIHTFGGSYPVWEQVKLPRLVRQLDLDLLHCTSNTAPVWCPVPLVVTIHDIIYLESNPLFAKGYTPYQRFGNIYRRWVVRQLLRKADAIYTVSHFERERFEFYLELPPGRVEVVYNGVGEHFRPITDQSYLTDMRTKYRLPERYCLFLGNTDPKKNTPNTVVAFAKYCQQFGRTHHLVVGDLEPALIQSYLDQAGLGEFMDQIHVTGYIDNQEMPALINLADVFLYPSKRESFGIPILEGMACGTPVITSKAASMPEVAGDAACLVDPLQPDSIAEVLGVLLHDADMQEKLRVAGLERARAFSWEQTARTSLASYRRLLGEPEKETA